MGCAAAKGQVYEAKQPQLSNRDIDESRVELGPVQSCIPSFACGYKFIEQLQNSDGSSAPNLPPSKQELHKAKAGEFFNIYAQMRQCYDSSQIDEAYSVRKQLKQMLGQLDLNSLNLDRSKQEEMMGLSELIKEDYSKILQFQKQLSSQKWENIPEDKMKLRIMKGRNVKVSVEKQSAVPLDLLIAAFASFQKISSILKFSTSSKELKKISTLRRLGEVIFDLPFCSKGPSYFEETIYNRLNHNSSVIIHYQSLYKNINRGNKMQFLPIYEAQHKMDFSSITCLIQSVQSCSKVTIVFDIKQDIEGIANWVLHKMYKNIGVATINKLLERARAYEEETVSQSFDGDDEIYHYFHNLLGKQLQAKHA